MENEMSKPDVQEESAKTPAQAEDKDKNKTKSELAEWIKDIAIAVAAAFVILQFMQPTIVREHSMENTLFSGDYLFVSKQSYKLLGKDPARGDIIILHSSLKTGDGKDKLLVKRVIGTPGDTLCIKDGAVIINGTALEENYTKDGYTSSEMEEITVPDGAYFVLGDNRQNSTDSRTDTVGFVRREEIMGKAVFRLFPFSKIGGLY